MGTSEDSSSNRHVSEITTVRSNGTFQQVLRDKDGRTLKRSGTWRDFNANTSAGGGHYLALENYATVTDLRGLPPSADQLPHGLALMPRDTFQPSPAQVAQSKQTTLGWETVFVMLAFAFWVVEIVDVARRKFSGEGTKIGWVLIVVLLNCLGALVYYFFGKSQGEIPVQNG